MNFSKPWRPQCEGLEGSPKLSGQTINSFKSSKDFKNCFSLCPRRMQSADLILSWSTCDLSFQLGFLVHSWALEWRWLNPLCCQILMQSLSGLPLRKNSNPVSLQITSSSVLKGYGVMRQIRHCDHVVCKVCLHLRNTERCVHLIAIIQGANLSMTWWDFFPLWCSQNRASIHKHAGE